MWARKFLSVFGVFHFGKACEPCNRNISVLTLISVRIVCCIEVACREYRELWKNDAKASWWNCAGCFAVAIFICFRINFFFSALPAFFALCRFSYCCWLVLLLITVMLPIFLSYTFFSVLFRIFFIWFFLQSRLLSLFCSQLSIFLTFARWIWVQPQHQYHIKAAITVSNVNKQNCDTRNNLWHTHTHTHT